ncbi:hypothetical protein [Actinomadura kijaniata]|uniref:hypothetical protein n=1 Tax=Actinomadura kijaniata TaxID=46161 RepID=UPI0008317FF3|nr:hypothetical protein [Actinomadura kijaniata]
MRPDGDPDDYGLPHVDVVVPDDPRDLHRDVLAYHRELRRDRRRARLRRVFGPVTRFGVAIPIIAGALLVALVSGVLLTTFGPRPMPRPTAALLNPHPTGKPGEVGGPLPEGRVTVVEGRPTEVSAREAIHPGVIGIAAPGCGCARTIADLAARTQPFQLNFWLVGHPYGGVTGERMSRELQTLGREVHAGSVQRVRDDRGLLAGAYAPGRPTGVTLVLVDTVGTVTDIVRDARPTPELQAKIKKLTES